MMWEGNPSDPKQAQAGAEFERRQNEEMRLDLIWCAVTFETIANTLKGHSATHYRWCEGLAREAAQRIRKWSQANV
jgi:hypothetical protein